MGAERQEKSTPNPSFEKGGGNNEGELKISKQMRKKEEKKINKNILFTIAYYNALGYQPTSFYIWKHLISVGGDIEKVGLSKIILALRALQKKQKIIEKNGFWQLNTFGNDLTGKQEQKILKKRVKLQIQKNKISTAKLQRARKWMKAVGWLPYLRGMISMGTLAMKRGGINSDWDVLVVTKKDRIWLGRLILTVWLQLLRKRRHGNRIQDRFCLNQFVTDSSLQFQERNEFAGNEILFSRCLGKEKNVYNGLLNNNIRWIKKNKPNFILRNLNSEEEILSWQNKIKIFLENLLEMFGLASLLNKISKKIMIRKIINNPKTYTSQADIRYGDFFLIFLPYPQRDVVRRKTLQLLTKVV